jgi:hypothetical protein
MMIKKHTHNEICHEHNGEKHSHEIDNANYDINLIIGDHNSNIGNEQIMTKRGGETVSKRKKYKTSKKNISSKLYNLLENSQVVKKNGTNIAIGDNISNIGNIAQGDNISNIGNIAQGDNIKNKNFWNEFDGKNENETINPYYEEKNYEGPKEEYSTEEDSMEGFNEQNFEQMLKFIDFEYILSEENIENIIDYISYCISQWDLYKDYMIPKDEFYQNMIDELYNDSLYTNNIDKDYDFISFENQFGGTGEENNNNKRSHDNTDKDYRKKTKTEPETETERSINESIYRNIIGNIFSKNDNYHDFLKGTRAVYLKPDNYDEKIKTDMQKLLKPQQIQHSKPDEMIYKYSTILQENPHDEGSVLKKNTCIR